jgi:hypothetical protein
MGSGQTGRYALPSHENRKCVKGHDLVRVVSVKVFSVGRDWMVEGYLFCPKCKELYKGALPDDDSD